MSKSKCKQGRTQTTTEKIAPFVSKERNSELHWTFKTMISVYPINTANLDFPKHLMFRNRVQVVNVIDACMNTLTSEHHVERLCSGSSWVLPGKLK